jgi:hypothetical protein
VKLARKSWRKKREIDGEMNFSTLKFAAAFVAIALLGLPGWPRNRANQEKANQDWAQSHFSAAFDQLFSIKGAEGDFIAVRAHRDHSNDLPEFSFVLQNTQDPKAISAVVREAQGTSLFEQLAALHAKGPSQSLEALKPDLKIGVWKLSAAQCPAISAQYTAFENIQFVRPRDDDPVEENPTLYEVNESVGGGESQVVEYVETRALPRWASQTHKLLDACIASAPAESRDTH